MGDTQYHLLVACHGLYGTPSEMERLVQIYQSAFPSLLTIAAHVAKLAQDDGVVVTHVSMVGYSMGGLVLRYAAGRLYHDGFFDAIKPLNFITLATPHLGVTGWVHGRNYAARWFLFRAGRQLAFTDSDAEYGGEPLLSALSNSKLPFHCALVLFAKVMIVANLVCSVSMAHVATRLTRSKLGDTVVPYLTASAQLQSPYRRTGMSDVVFESSESPIVRPRQAVDIDALPPPPKFVQIGGPRLWAFRLVVYPLFLVVALVPGMLLVMLPRVVRNNVRARSRHIAARTGLSAAVDNVALVYRRLHDFQRVLAIAPLLRRSSTQEYQRRIVASLELTAPRLERVDVWLPSALHTHRAIIPFDKTYAHFGSPTVRALTKRFIDVGDATVC
ncbi:hypothetical protein RI367_008408 [Sorochytrium milnesiophthora]